MPESVLPESALPGALPDTSPGTLPESALPAAVLFDMDGTLVDTEQLWWRTAVEIAEELGHPLTERDAPEVLGQAVEHTAAHLHRVSGTALGEAELAVRLGGSFAAKVAAETVPRPGALALLASLRDSRVPTALVSASPREVVDLVLAAIGRDWFAVTLAAEDTERTKPAPDPYLAAAERLGLDPAVCLAVEDTPTGVASATAAGCAVLAVPSTPTPMPEGDRITLLASLEQADLALLGKLAATPAV
ncbi:HAD family hydrolase [Kitasatospora sp. NPDC093550]|uniref:HAD family hydrolase n=1 Tax=Kitasatospora sp. NPDC093550 TaxID=3364089 RepID=UPI0037F4FEC8